jgi:hypothetical protein
LAALGGPVGFAAGLLGTGLLRERGKEQDALGAAAAARQRREDAFGGPVSGQALPELLDRAFQMEGQGFSSDIVTDQIQFLQGEQSKRDAEQRARDQPLGFNVGTYNPRDYTAESWANAQEIYQSTKDPVAASRALERFEEPTSPFGAIGQGMARVEGPDGQVREVPIPGSREYAARVQPIQETRYAMDVARRLISEIEDTGGESFGAASKRQNLLYNQMLSVLGQLTNAGVLQQGELERFSQALQNPTDYTARIRTDKSLKAPYEELVRQLEMRLVDGIENLGFAPPGIEVPGEGGPGDGDPQLPPGFIWDDQ